VFTSSSLLPSVLSSKRIIDWTKTSLSFSNITQLNYREK
jgi:hypothetical protein